MNPYVFEPKRPVVETAQGKLRGITYGGVNLFMGVPYAHAKRFQMPEKITPWEGIRDAYRHGPVAMQILPPNTFSYYRGIHLLELQSEDCQNLNIWASVSKDGEKKPVFVWLHGGGFFAGNAFEEMSFDGFNLAHHGDVIFVSVNHRLNVLGYLNLEEYGEKYRNSANAGIADLVTAMQWIHENIEAFGGDPDNVTICGHSGGGSKVQCLFQIEEAACCFNRGICLSGASYGDFPPAITAEGSKALAKALLNELGITRETIHRIDEIPFSEIAKACEKVATPFSWAPLPNDYFPGYPASVGVMPFSRDKPMIYGSTLGEFPPVSFTAEEKEAMTEEDRISYLKDRFGDKGEELIKLFRQAYPDHDILDLAYADTRFRIGAVRSAQAHARSGSDQTYLFLASYCAPEEGYMPIWHGGEVAYIFMNEDKVLALNEPVYGQKYGQILSSLVLNFTRYGDPNNDHLPMWTPVTTEDDPTMIIDRTCRLVSHHDDELMELLTAAIPAKDL